MRLFLTDTTKVLGLSVPSWNIGTFLMSFWLIFHLIMLLMFLQRILNETLKRKLVKIKWNLFIFVATPPFRSRPMRVLLWLLWAETLCGPLFGTLSDPDLDMVRCTGTRTEEVPNIRTEETKNHHAGPAPGPGPGAGRAAGLQRRVDVGVLGSINCQDRLLMIDSWMSTRPFWLRSTQNTKFKYWAESAVFQFLSCENYSF